MQAIIIFCLLSLLLVIGKILRVAIPLLQRLYLPSSVIGGLLGLALFQCFPGLVCAETISGISRLPGFLINIVFASLFLGVVTPPLKKVFTQAFPQLCFGQVSAWGQYVLGIGLCGFVLIPLYKVNAGFGNLLEIGFQGGHGTVAGMASTFETYWKEGTDIGNTMATAGMMLGIIVGMIMVNIAGRKGYVSNVRKTSDMDKFQQMGLYHHNEAPAAGKQTVYCDSIDSLAFHISLVGLAVLLGYILLVAMQRGEVLLFPNAAKRVLAGFPLFPLCMIGGLLMQKSAQALKINKLIDRGQMQRIAGAALDFLVVSAVATIKLKVVAAFWQPLLIMIAAGTLLGVVLVMFVAPRLFKESWFECAIADFGQAMGVTATGLLLLRTVDPESKTCAAQSFGYKQLIHEPFMGGGIWTALALTLVFTIGWQKLFLISSIFFMFWLTIMLILIKKNNK
ncbi:MAG: sodium:glutamate symporter [Lentisphaerae bacterium]|nr:sodium:glutamate symporter [Lentisphaerota bacterium]